MKRCVYVQIQKIRREGGGLPLDLCLYAISAVSRSHTLTLSSFSAISLQAKTHVCDIEQRLQGVIKSRNKVLGLPLSIEGHVHYLIQEATDDKLLCQMYLGWGPYL